MGTTFPLARIKVPGPSELNFELTFDIIVDVGGVITEATFGTAKELEFVTTEICFVFIFL